MGQVSVVILRGSLLTHGITHKHRINTARLGIKVAIVVLVLFLQGTSNSIPAYCQSAVSDEYLVKLAFLFNFAKFVRWPDRAFAEDKAPLLFCVFGENPFGNRLKVLENKTIAGRPIVTQRANTLSQIGHCHVLYISSSKRAHLKQVLNEVKGRPVLTVSDIPGFACHGGIIGLFKWESKVRFAIDQHVATESGLSISSQLMKLSKNCRDK